MGGRARNEGHSEAAGGDSRDSLEHGALKPRAPRMQASGLKDAMEAAALIKQGWGQGAPHSSWSHPALVWDWDQEPQ